MEAHAGDALLEHRLERGELFLTEAAVVERLRHEFRLPADDLLAYAGAIYDEASAAALRSIYDGYLQAARRHGVPLLLTSSTRRADPQRTAASQYAGRDLEHDWMAFLRELCLESDDVFVGGLVGVAGDAYRPDTALAQREAATFHRRRCEAFADAGADFLLAATLPALSEAMGLATAMADTGLPRIISFIVDRRGMLLDGTPLSEAITAIDATDPPTCYLVNCVHPANLLAGLAAAPNRDRPSLARLKGIQANASTRGAEDLDGRCELQTDGADSLVEAMVTLRRMYAFQIFGGCCGTDGVLLDALATALAAGAEGADVSRPAGRPRGGRPTSLGRSYRAAARTGRAARSWGSRPRWS